jgi:hypothetical protein
MTSVEVREATAARDAAGACCSAIPYAGISTSSVELSMDANSELVALDLKKCSRLSEIHIIRSGSSRKNPEGQRLTADSTDMTVQHSRTRSALEAPTTPRLITI